MNISKGKITRKMIIKLRNLQDSEQTVDIYKLRKAYSILSEVRVKK